MADADVPPEAVNAAREEAATFGIGLGQLIQSEWRQRGLCCCPACVGTFIGTFLGSLVDGSDINLALEAHRRAIASLNSNMAAAFDVTATAQTTVADIPTTRQ